MDKEPNHKGRVLTEEKLDGMNENEIIPSSTTLQAILVYYVKTRYLDVAVLECASLGSS
jgi:hypothetical protein